MYQHACEFQYVCLHLCVYQNAFVCISVRVFVCISGRVFVCISGRVFVCISGRVFVCVSVRVFVCVSVRVFVCISGRVFVCISVRVFVCISVRVFVCRSVHTFVCISVREFVYQRACVCVSACVCVPVELADGPETTYIAPAGGQDGEVVGVQRQEEALRGELGLRERRGVVFCGQEEPGTHTHTLSGPQAMQRLHILRDLMEAFVGRNVITN